jgi:Tfp pilus assembly protein PilF
MKPTLHHLTTHLALLACATLTSLSAATWAQASPTTTQLAQGDAQWAAGKLDLAQKSFEDAVAAQPKSVEAQMKLGGLQMTRLDFRAANETYKKAIGLDANHAKAWLGLGFSYLHGDQKDLALAAFNEAIRIEPSYKDRLATVVAKLGSN